MQVFACTGAKFVEQVRSMHPCVKTVRFSTVQAIPMVLGGKGMPKSCCSGCGRMFTSLSAFDLHRTGKFQRKMRCCLTDQEMRERGMVQNEKGWWMRSAFDGALPWHSPEEAREEAL